MCRWRSGTTCCVPALPEFTRRYPLIELDLRLNDRVVDLVAESVDVALRVRARAPVRPRRAPRGQLQHRDLRIAPPTCREHGEPKTPDDLRQHRLLGLAQASGAPPEWSFPPPYSPKRLGLKFAMVFNAAEAPVIAAAAGLGITHTVDLFVAEYVARGQLQLILEDYILPGPPMSLVYPSAGHQSAKVRVFSDFAADLLLRWQERVRPWIAPAPARRRRQPDR